MVDPAAADAMAEELPKPLRALAEGREFRRYCRDLPLDHRGRRTSHLGDALILGEGNELVMEERSPA